MRKADYIFVCKNGFDRSVVGARVFLEMARERGIEVTTSSGGLGIEESQTGEDICGEILRNAKIVFVMNSELEMKVIGTYYVPRENVVNLEVPDNFDIHYKINGLENEGKLEEIFRESLRPYVEAI